MISFNDIEYKLDIAIKAARTGGEFLVQNRFAVLQKFMKGEEGDFATYLDLSVEKIIKNIFLTTFPEIPIIGEETGLSGQKPEKDTDQCWYIDPLDGTKAFFRGNVAFVSISIALATKNEILLGVVYNPFTQTIYSATSNSTTLINGRSITASSFPEKLSQARIILDFSPKLPVSLRRVLLEQELDNTFNRVFRYEGSIAQHLALISSGVHHGGLFWGTSDKGNFWDIGAAALICKQAKIEMTNFFGNPLTPSSTDFGHIIAGPKLLYQALKDFVQPLLSLDESSTSYHPNNPLEEPVPVNKKSSPKSRSKKHSI